jgi:hypothetical protein
MKALTESDIIRIFQEENQKRLDSLHEELDMYFKSAGDVENVISKELKIKHKKSGIRFTVDSVSPRHVVLRSPEGVLKRVSQDVLEQEFELD